MSFFIRRLFGIHCPGLDCVILRIGRDEHRYIDSKNSRSVIIYTEMQLGSVAFIIDFGSVLKNKWSDGGYITTEDGASIRENLDLYFAYRGEKVEYQ